MSIDFRDDLRADIQPSYIDGLMHHGIKGMHWGVRRPRNEDGIIDGAGARLAAEQKRHQANADYWRKGADTMRKKRQEVEDYYRDKKGIGNGIRRNLGLAISDYGINKFTKNAAGAQWNADRMAAAKELHDWGERANRGYAKNHDDARMARSAEKAVSRFNAANDEARKRYARTVNAKAIAKANEKANAFKKKANFHNSMDRGLDKHSRELGLAGQIIATPARGTARAYGAYYNLRSKMARNRARRLSGE